MPPQPLSRVVRGDTLMRIDRVFQERPGLHGYVAEVVRLGALIDYTWSLVLIGLLKADRRTGVAMYQALTSAEAKRAALVAAATSRLQADDVMLFKACLRAGEAVRRVRNNFAHRIWAYSQDVPDALLLCDPEDLTKVTASAADTSDLLQANIDKVDFSKVQVWKERAFKEAVQGAVEYLGAVRELETGLQFFGPGINLQTRALLLKRPPIAQAHATLSRQAPRPA